MAERCPKCGASVRADADWCALCYADLRPPPALPPQPVAPPAPAAPHPAAASPISPPPGLGAPPGLGGDPLSDPLVATTGDGAAVASEPVAMWPCANCGAANPMAADACGACGVRFGAGLSTGASVMTREQRNRLRVVAAMVALGIVGIVALVTILTSDVDTNQPAPIVTLPPIVLTEPPEPPPSG